MIIMGVFFSFILVLFRRNDGGWDDAVPVFLHSSLYKVLVSTGSFLLFKKEKSNTCSQERRIMGRKREEFIRRSVFVLQRDLKLSFPKQTNQKRKKKNWFRASFLLDPGGTNLRRLHSEPHTQAQAQARVHAHAHAHTPLRTPDNRSVKG